MARIASSLLHACVPTCLPACTSPPADKAYKGSPTVFLFLGEKQDTPGCLHYEKVGDYWQLMIGDCVFWYMGAVA